MSRSQTPGKSRSSFRLYFFTFLSVIACALALANVATAASPSGEDQYIEKAPTGGGNTDKNTFLPVDTNGDGVISEAEVKAAAEKNKKAKKPTADKSDDGSTGGTGAVGGTTPTPPAAGSVATAAKLGPFDRKVGIALLMVAVLAGMVALFKSGFIASIAGSAGVSSSRVTPGGPPTDG